MNKYDPLLKVRFDGEAVGASKIPLPHLSRFLSCLNKALRQTERALKGDASSVRRGRPPHNTKQELELDLVSLTHGSPAAVLGFDRNEKTLSSAEKDFGMRVLEKTLDGLKTAQEKGAEEALPPRYDEEVLGTWSDVGNLFRRGISRIEFTLNHRAKPMRMSFTLNGLERIRKRIRRRIKKAETDVREIEGRLLMADFKERGSRVRVHPSVGEPVICHFNEERADEVVENILHYVRIAGTAKEDPVSRKIKNIKIHKIERLDEAVALLSQGPPVSRTFWESPSLEELARLQNVKPMEDVRSLSGMWPGAENDGFEAAIEELRHPDAKNTAAHEC